MVMDIELIVTFYDFPPNSEVKFRSINWLTTVYMKDGFRSVLSPVTVTHCTIPKH
jgi:hypothetical protein